MSFRVESLDHLVLTVADIAATCDFYVRVLGCEVVRFGEGRTALAFGRQKINLHPVENDVAFKAAKPAPGSADLCFLTATPIEEVQRHLASCGVQVIDGPAPRTGATGPILSVYFRDPDQNLIEVSNLIS